MAQLLHSGPARAQARLAIGATLLCIALLGCGGNPCSGPGGPVFLTGNLPAATVGRAYSVTIEVGISQEPDDDDFDYTFTVGSTLPPGLLTTQIAKERRITIAGTPTTTGTFDFEVRVLADLPNYWYLLSTPLCWTVNDKRYRIEVTN